MSFGAQTLFGWLRHVFLFVLSLPVDFAKIPSRAFNFIRRSVSREPCDGSGYASGKIHIRVLKS